MGPVDIKPRFTQMGPVDIKHKATVHTKLPPSPLISWTEFGGKLTWLPLNFGYHDLMRKAPIALQTSSSPGLRNRCKRKSSSASLQQETSNFSLFVDCLRKGLTVVLKRHRAAYNYCNRHELKVTEVPISCTA